MTEEIDQPSPARPLTWWRFLLQSFTVLLVFLGASVIPILDFGNMDGNLPGVRQTSVSLALSALFSMVGALFVAWLWLRRDRAVAQAFNFARPESWARTFTWGVAGTAIILLIFAGGAQVVEFLGLPSPEVESVIQYATESPAAFAMWIVLVAWCSAAFGEEMLWRGFLMDRLSRLSGLRGRTLLILFVQAFVFGLPHAYQGWGGVLITGSVGLFLGWLRMHMGGRLWAAIIAHGLVDTIMLSLGYAEVLGWYSG